MRRVELHATTFILRMNLFNTYSDGSNKTSVGDSTPLRHSGHTKATTKARHWHQVITIHVAQLSVATLFVLRGGHALHIPATKKQLTADIKIVNLFIGSMYRRWSSICIIAERRAFHETKSHLCDDTRGCTR